MADLWKWKVVHMQIPPPLQYASCHYIKMYPYVLHTDFERNLNYRQQCLTKSPILCDCLIQIKYINALDRLLLVNLVAPET